MQLEWCEPHAERPARTVFRGKRPKDRAHPTRGTEKLIEYKTYLQALPYFDRLEGDRGVTEWKSSLSFTSSEAYMTK